MDSSSAPSPAGLTNGHSGPNGVNGSSSFNSSPHARVPKRLYSLSQPPSLSAFETLCSQSTSRETYPHAATVTSNIPIYDLPADGDARLADGSYIDALQDEWHHILLSGPGVMVLRDFYRDRALLERVNEVFAAIIASESEPSAADAAAGAGADADSGSAVAPSKKKGDHFAASGSNARIWNSFQKHALRDPASFARYYANPYLAAVCAAWLGPGYQITAQVNVVHPGGKPQVPHRDYHLGFQTAEACAQFPAATQTASALLTLQGAVAHSDMPLASGPTRFLPFSQLFAPGFMAYRLPEFQAFFAAHWVSLPLRAGDAVFFNPALFHAAGENRTPDVHRSANLLQVSSAFGRTMESIDSLAIIARCWDEVRKMYAEDEQGGNRGGTEVRSGATGCVTRVQALLSAMGSGYPFPTNLDRRPPAPGGMAPESEVDILRKGLQEGWNVDEVVAAITAIRADSMP
ncbi:uncharacterized protein PV07_05847 [Cladophialophora immunda]|uniref:Phytanoyl-CoA dioxygenase n=1 Tax=Cladophialophora immunda TaxID=569365 RepID=A0A0D1ZQ05_9EURO|nr:uncharacterized protein PV07_05847 [Cladophialophora immunda]KIW30071.1 hypothetical protein PV07_05847 [Cladophialophora immunda]